VDIFSLGMCMYETMSLALVPPKEYNMFEFDEEIKNGIRPGFLEKALCMCIHYKFLCDVYSGTFITDNLEPKCFLVIQWFLLRGNNESRWTCWD